MALNIEYQTINLKLFRQYRITRTIYNRNLIVEANQNLVYTSIRRYQGLPGFEAMKLDLIQEGSIGLVKAVEKFDHSRNIATFSSYAKFRIQGDISHYLRDKHWSVQKPRNLYELVPKIAKVIAEAREKKELISKEAICKKLNITPEELDAVRLANLSTIPVSLNQRYEEENTELIDFLPSSDDRYLSDDYEALRQTIEHLPDQLRIIFSTLLKEGTIAATARKLEAVPATVKRRYEKGLVILKENLSSSFC
jgi:RNA polymerase sigma-B factor